MARKKKVTIHIHLDNDEQEVLKVRVTFNKRTIRFNITDPDHLSVKDFENPNRVQFYKNKLEKILRYEYSKVGDEYKMNGLTTRISLYKHKIATNFKINLSNHLLRPLGDVLTYNQFNAIKNSFFTHPKFSISPQSYFILPSMVRFLENYCKVDLDKYMDDRLVDEFKVFNLFLHVDNLERERLLSKGAYNRNTHKQGAYECIDWIYSDDLKHELKSRITKSSNDFLIQNEVMDYFNDRFPFYLGKDLPIDEVLDRYANPPYFIDDILTLQKKTG